MRSVFNKTLLEIARENPRIFMILADIGYGEIDIKSHNGMKIIAMAKWGILQYRRLYLIRSHPRTI